MKLENIDFYYVVNPFNQNQLIFMEKKEEFMTNQFSSGNLISVSLIMMSVEIIYI